jgi:hypothetical protein
MRGGLARASGGSGKTHQQKKSWKLCRDRAKARFALAKWKKLVEKTKVLLWTDAEKRQKFYISLWNLKVRKSQLSHILDS